MMMTDNVSTAEITRIAVEAMVAKYGKTHLTEGEVAEMLGVDRRTVRKMIERRYNTLRAFNAGTAKRKIYMVPIAALINYHG